MENPSEFQIPVNSIRTPFIDPSQKSSQKSHEITSNQKINHIKPPFFPRQLPDLRVFSQRFAFTADVGLAPGHRLAGALGALRAAARLPGGRAGRGCESVQLPKRSG